MARTVPTWLVWFVLLAFLALPAWFVLPSRGASVPPPPRPSFCASAHFGPGAEGRQPLGLFVHYGPSSLVNATSTQRWWRAMIAPSYSATVARFKPRPQAADGWFTLAKRIGAGYVAITAKHHDGYTLWRSDTTSYGVGERDVIARAARDAHRTGLGLVLYFSLIDEHARSFPSDWPAYLRLVKAQLRELLTRYGPIAGIWFDGPGWMLSRSAAEWGLPELYHLIHHYQPSVQIVTNHHCTRPLAGEAILTHEGEVPAKRQPFAQQVAFSLSDQWFYSTRERPITHRRYLTLKKRAARAAASLLINVPPRADGTFAPAYLSALGVAGDR
jgi:alpha-L-fucosidase